MQAKGIAIVTPIEVRIDSDEASVRSALAAVVGGMTPFALSPDDIATLELVLAEALNNVVEHAYPRAAEHAEIRISCRYDTNGLHITICDDGQPMPRGVAPTGKPQRIEGPVDALPEGGFGRHLIHTLASEVTYRRLGSENRLDLRLAIGTGPA